MHIYDRTSVRACTCYLRAHARKHFICVSLRIYTRINANAVSCAFACGPHVDLIKTQNVFTRKKSQNSNTLRSETFRMYYMYYICTLRGVGRIFEGFHDPPAKLRGYGYATCAWAY